MATRFRWFVISAGIVGFLLGFVVSTFDIWPEFLQRFLFSLRGGAGESSDWGEPLFYPAVFGVPSGAMAALLTMTLVFAVKWIRNPKTEPGR